MTDNTPHSGYFVLEPLLGGTGRFAHDKSMRNASGDEIEFYMYGGFDAELTVRNSALRPRQIVGQQLGNSFIFKYPQKGK